MHLNPYNELNAKTFYVTVVYCILKLDLSLS